MKSALGSVLAVSYVADLPPGMANFFQFGFDFAGRTSPEGTFSEWEEVTGRYERSPYRGQVEHALRLLERERGSRRG